MEEHLAQQVHGLEDVLHGVDPARPGKEGKWSTVSRWGAGVQPGMHTEPQWLLPGLAQHNHNHGGPMFLLQLREPQGDAINTQTSVSLGERSSSSSPGSVT